MCRAYPGFRCSSHPSLVFRTLSRKLHNLEQEKEAVLAERALYREDTPDWENSEEDLKFTEIIENFDNEIDVLEARRQQEATDYYMTPTGQEVLAQAIADKKKNSPAKRHDLAAEMVAAESRRFKQKKVADFMRGDVPVVAKIWRANRELKNSKVLLRGYEDRAVTLRDKLLKVEEKLIKAKEAKNPEAIFKYSTRKKELYQEYSFVDRQAKHMRAHIATTKSWLEKMNETLVHKSFNFTDALAMSFIRYTFQ